MLSVEISAPSHPQAQLDKCRTFFVDAIGQRRANIKLMTDERASFIISTGPSNKNTALTLVDNGREVMTASFDAAIGAAFATDLFVVAQFSVKVP